MATASALLAELEHELEHELELELELEEEDAIYGCAALSRSSLERRGVSSVDEADNRRARGGAGIRL